MPPNRRVPFRSVKCCLQGLNPASHHQIQTERVELQWSCVQAWCDDRGGDLVQAEREEKMSISLARVILI